MESSEDSMMLVHLVPGWRTTFSRRLEEIFIHMWRGRTFERLVCEAEAQRVLTPNLYHITAKMH